MKTELVTLLTTLNHSLLDFENDMFVILPEEAKRFNKLLSDFVNDNFEPVKMKISVSVDGYDSDFINSPALFINETFNEFLKFSIDITDGDDMFEQYDKFLIDFNKLLKSDEVFYEVSYGVNGGYLQRSSYAYYQIKATFSTEFDLLSFTIDNDDFTEIINNNISVDDIDSRYDFHYHRAKKNYHTALKKVKLSLGLMKDDEPETYHKLLKFSHYNRRIEISKARIKKDGFYNTSDVNERNFNSSELTYEKEILLGEYTKKVEEFNSWKREMEGKLLDTAYGFTLLDNINVGDEVLYSNSERMILVKIESLPEDGSDDKIIAKEILENGKLRRKKLSFINDEKFYLNVN